jgi:diaminopimelate epimerase
MVPFPFYDARGNTYFVATPAEIGKLVALPESAPEAARSYESWANAAVERVRSDLRNANGLLVGPFPDEEDGYGFLIVNTDGSLAEFSGNGSTIFSQFLVDTHVIDRSRTFFANVHHDRSKAMRVRIKPDEQDGAEGFLIQLDPIFGPQTVVASVDDLGASQFGGRGVVSVFPLTDISPAWCCSQFVRVGNPHCVTFLETPDALTLIDRNSSKLTADLAAIANSSVSGKARGKGRPCKYGINLQWASVVAPGEIHALVFERGEGWTKSSGSSATAVASAARHLGLTTETTVHVAMPGGVAPVRFDERSGRVLFFGEARRVSS